VSTRFNLRTIERASSLTRRTITFRDRTEPRKPVALKAAVGLYMPIGLTGWTGWTGSAFDSLIPNQSLNLRSSEACMKLLRITIPLCCLLTSLSLSAAPSPGAADGEDRLVYADFETMKDGRPVSNRGGHVQLFAGQQNPVQRCQFKGAAGTNAPELVRLSPADPNKAATFEYLMPTANEWANVTLEVSGQPDQDGKPIADDVSRYRSLTLQLYVTGVSNIRVEFNSRGQGLRMDASPQMIFKVSPGFNTYKVPLNNLGQPPWAETRINPKDVLKKLTSIGVTVFCNQCALTKGTVVVDNLVFQS
jgi:hypothetical protein